MPQEPQAHWAQAPASPPLDVVDTEKGAKEDEMADRPSSGQVSGEVAANEKQAAGDQTSDAHDLSRPSQVCEDEPFDMEKAIGGLGTTQRRLATLHATDALGISEQQAIYILETTAQAVIESCTTQFQQDHASVLSMAARLLLEMASYSKGMGQQQTAEEQSMAAGMISKVSFQIKMACQPQANGPSECPVTAGQTQSHSSLPAEETSQRDVVLDEQAIPSQCWGQQQVIREQATTAQTQWHPAKGQQIAVRDRATAAQVCYNANPKQCRPISEAESTSQKSFDRGHPMAKQVGLPRTGQQQVFREQATTAQMQWRPAKPASTGQQIAVREQAMAVQVCYNTDPKQCLPIFGAENTSQKPFDKGHPMAKQVGLPQCRGQQQIITEQVTTAQTQWHPVNGPASTSQQIAVGEQAMAVQICFNTVEKQCRPISEAGNTSQKSFDGEHPMAKQVGLPQCWGQQQLTREQAHTTAQMQWRPAKPASTGQQRAERQQAVAVQVCYNTDPKQCLPISEEENTSQQKSFAREPPMAIQACSGAAFTVGRKSQQKDVLKQRARTGKKRPRAAVTNKLGEESLMSSANGQAAAHHTSSSAASGNGPLDAINWKCSDRFKVRLHMWFLMRFLMRFRIQNAPYPTLHECFFHEASCGLSITYYLKTPLFPISANLVVFCRSVTRLKTHAG